jgi:hypothetical protein
MLPGSDSTYFRGLSEYFLKTDNLNASQLNHGYFQWPGFFILTKNAAFTGGLGIVQVEFIQYSIIGFLLTCALYIYSYKFFKNNSPVVVLAFFVMAYSFLNYQDVPFSLALGLLFVILLILETKPKTFSIITTILILFTSITLTHAFVPLFYILFTLIMLILKKNKFYGLLCLSTSLIFILIQLTMAQTSFFFNIQLLFRVSSEFSTAVNQTLTPVSSSLDTLMQTFTRSVTISLLIISAIGFIILLKKRKLRDFDKALFLTGLLYSAVGAVLYILGTRAIPIILIPLSLGTYYFFGSRRGNLKILFIILLVLSVSIPIHTTLSNPPMILQKHEDYLAANFMIEENDWGKYNTILIDVGLLWYIYPQIESNSTLIDVYLPNYNGSDIAQYDTILYSLSLQNELQNSNTPQEISQAVFEYHNVIYNSGSLSITEKIG